MDSIGVINPESKEIHYIPYQDLGAAMEAGGQFASEKDKQKAIRYQQLSQGKSEIASSPFNPKESEIPETPFNDRPAPPEEVKGWKGLGADTVDLLSDMLKGGIGFAQRTPENAKDIGKQLITNPIKTIPHIDKQLIASLGEGAKTILNLPYKGIKELGQKDLIPEWLKKYIELPFTHIPEDTGVEKLLGLESTRPSDELIRALPALGVAGMAAAKVVGKTVRKVTSPSKERLFQRALEDKIDKLKEEKHLSEAEVNHLQDALRLQFSEKHGKGLGEVTPVGQQVSINQKKLMLEEKRPSTEIPEKDVGEIPPEPDTKAIIEEKKAAVESARKQAEETLGTLNNPRLKGGEKVKKAIEDVKVKASDLYNSARSHYRDKQIKADNNAEIREVTKDLEDLKNADELAPGYGSGTNEQKALETKLEALKGEEVNASDIFDLQRTLETMADNTRRKQFESGKGTTDLERKRLGGIAERLDAHATTLRKRLESVGGKEVQSMIKEANKGWKTYKDLERENPVGKAALKGELPVRSMIEIAKAHPGNDFLNALVEKDPELKKHILAAYAGENNVNKLMKPNTIAKKYLEALPEVEDHVNALKQALSGVKEGEIQADKVKKEYGALVKSMKKVADEQKVRQDAIKQSEELRKQIKFHESAIPKLDSKIKAAEQKGLEHDKLSKELANHKRDLQDKNHLLKKILSVTLKATGVSTLLHKIGL